MYAKYIEDEGLFKNLASWLCGYSDTRQKEEPFANPYKYGFHPVKLNEKTQNKFESRKVYYVLCDKDGNLAMDCLFAKNFYGTKFEDIGKSKYAFVSLCFPKKYSKKTLDMCKEISTNQKEWHFAEDDCVVDLETGKVVYRVEDCGYDHFLKLYGSVCVDRKKGMRAVYLPTGETVFETHDLCPKHSPSKDGKFVFFYDMTDYSAAEWLVRVNTETGEILDCMK